MSDRIWLDVVLIILAGCSFPTHHHYDSSVNFGKFKTFSFISAHPLMRVEGIDVSPMLESGLSLWSLGLGWSLLLRRITGRCASVHGRRTCY